jgi:hypothetical protein
LRQIALSYRRADSSAIAGRIQEHLSNHFGADDVFMDIDAIPFGEDFRDYIDDALRHAVAMVLVIGPKWLGPKRRGIYRIQDATDPVRIEVETAMRLGIRIVPVLVEDATMPQPSDLPETLGKLPFINAATVDSGRDFRIHMERVIRALEVVLERAGVAAPAPSEPMRAAPSPPAEPVKLAPEVFITPAAPVTPVAPAEAAEPAAAVAPARAEIAARLTGAWWVSLVRGLSLLAAGALQLAYPVGFHHNYNLVALSNGVALVQVVALTFMIGAAKGLNFARIAFACELVFYVVGSATQSMFGLGFALLLSLARAAAEACAGAALGRYVRAENVRVALGGVLMFLTVLITLILLYDRSSGAVTFTNVLAPLVSGLAFVVLGLILRSAKNRAAR